MTQETINEVLEFRDDRDWKQFHNPKDLAISISLEAAELLEVFQWSAGDVVCENKTVTTGTKERTTLSRVRGVPSLQVRVNKKTMHTQQRCSGYTRAFFLWKNDKGDDIVGDRNIILYMR